MDGGTIVGIIITLIVAYVFYILGINSTRKTLNQQTKEVGKAFVEPLSEVRLRIDEVVRLLQKDHPELASQIDAVMKRNEIVPLFDEYNGDGLLCPECKQGQLSMERYGVGPLGSFNAIYKCPKCNCCFQTLECAND